MSVDLSDKGLRVAELVKSGAGQVAPIERAPGVYESRGVGNSYLLTTPEGDVLVNAGTLGGSGNDVSAFTVASGASIAPGDPVSDPIGDFFCDTATFASGSTLKIDIDGAGTSDAIVAFGAVNISGATLALTEAFPGTRSGRAK